MNLFFSPEIPCWKQTLENEMSSKKKKEEGKQLM